MPLRGAHVFVAVCCFLVLFLSVVPAANGQAGDGQIRGTVRDQSSSAVPAAEITIRSLATGSTRATVSNDSGYFVFLAVGPGEYEIQCAKPGFKVEVRPRIEVQTQSVSIVDFNLIVGQVHESITVEAREEVLKTQDPSQSTIVDAKRLDELPLKTRYFAELTELSPGVAPRRTPQNRFEGSGAGGFVHGLRKNMNSFKLDGSDLDDPGFRGDNLQVNGRVGEDSLREIQMILGTSDASFGHAAGAQVNLTTKSGTNQVHGSAFDYLRNEKLDARDFFATTGPKPPFKQNIFGFTLGGPFVKEKHFWFGTYEGYYQRRSVATGGLAPTPLLLSNIPTGPAVGNLRDVLAAAYPAPTPGFSPTALTAPFQTTLPDVISTNQFTIRTDHKLTSQDNVFVRFWWLNSVTTAGSSFASLATGTSTFGVDRRQWNAAIGYRRTFSAAAVNEFRASVFRPTVVLSGRGPTKPGLTALGFPSDPDADGSLGFTVFAGTGLTAIGQLNFLPTGRINTIYQFGDTYSYSHGNHLLQFGGDFIGLIENDFLENARRPFTLFVGFGPPLGFGSPGLTTGSFLLQNQNFFNNPSDSHRGLRSKDWSFFAGDTWRIHPQVTLSLGIRYEYFGRVNEVNGFLNNAYQADSSGKLIPNAPITNPSNIILANVDGSPISKRDANNWAPRIGIAYHPFARTVVRGGYSLAYDKAYFNQFVNIRSNPPFVTSTTLFFRPFGSVANPAVNGLTPNLTSVSPDLVAPYVHNYHLTLEQEVMTDTTLTIAYVGNSAKKLTLIEAPNLQGSIPAASRPNRNFLTWEVLTNHSYSNYNGLEIEAKRRLRGGLAIQASYTFAKTLDLRSLADTISGQSEVLPSDKDNLRLDYGLADFHIPHNFKVNWYYELPFGHSKRWGSTWSGATQQVLGGWMIGGRGAIFSGFPFSILSNTDLNGDGSTNNDRAPITASDANSLVLNQGTQFLKPNLIGTVILNVPTLPPSGKNILRGPRQNIWDISLGKDFKITERIKLNFRALMFNVFNHPNFEAPNVERGNTIADPSNANFGRLIATTRGLDNRIIEMAFKLSF
jgi:hypothetical protein